MVSENMTEEEIEEEGNPENFERKEDMKTPYVYEREEQIRAEEIHDRASGKVELEQMRKEGDVVDSADGDVLEVGEDKFEFASSDDDRRNDTKEKRTMDRQK